MFGFYNVIGRIARPIAAVALIGLFVQADAMAQIAFPDNAYPRAVVFADDGGDEVQIVGTHSFGVYRSVPGAIGTNKWAEANSGLGIPITVNDVFVTSGGTVLLGTSGSGGQQSNVDATGLFSSADAGATWTAVEKSAFDTLAVHTVQAIAEGPGPTANVLYLSADDGNIFLSQDGGATWIFNGRLPGGSSQLPWSLLAHSSTAGTVYAGTFGYGVYVSTDFGAGWAPFTDNASLLATTGHGPLGSSGAGGNYVFDLEMNPASPNQMFAATAKGVWRFDDVTASGTWTRMAAADSSFTLLDGTVYRAHPEVRSLAFNNAGTTLYMATWGFGVLTTTAFTGAPTPTQIALRNAQVSTVAVSPSGAVFAGTTSGLYEIVSASSTDVTPEGDLPTSFTLGQNYPNPFNPTTNIQFELPVSTDVSLAVFDVLGRRVALLATGAFPAGVHSVTLDASKLQSGLYIYRLDAGDQSISRTMSLVK